MLAVRPSLRYLLVGSVILSACVFFFLLKTGEPIGVVEHPISKPSASPPPSPSPASTPEPSSTPLLHDQQPDFNITSAPPPNLDDHCNVNIEHLRELGYNQSIEYGRWDIAVVRTPDFQDFSLDLNLTLPAFEPIDLDTAVEVAFEHCSPDATIHAPPRQPRADASHMIFGFATSKERLIGSLEAFQYWAGGTGARMFGCIDGITEPERKQIEQMARERDIQLTIIHSTKWLLDVQDMYFALVKILWDNRDENTKWAVIIDDDTFFPSMRNLIKRMETYDDSKPQYIGAPTEDFDQMRTMWFMGYGGAGVFMSMPLLEQINEHYSECSLSMSYGDRRVAECIYKYTSTKLTWDRGLFQLDIKDNADGFYEAGRPLPLSLHHWKSWTNVDVVRQAMVAEVCGDDCQLRRWRIDNHWWLINGFSIVQYSKPLTNLLSMEQTWALGPMVEEFNYGHSLGPLREADSGKVSYRLKSATVDGNVVRQIYVHDPALEGLPRRVWEVVWTVIEEQ
ncbi:hypothetical protein N7474_003134 [Penicillium riverlandense]|uniref:uncharacterized protein n=1 Tax=Penicillium riverlandense TaxID=1903569 RepID=UPI002546B4E4|nr:uncharacterized protein N7474_003134 [Penicillium riverlandense]KAJ5825996.1 hypothetical protein N7474_003134 [Penicillium riverlandense]